MEMKTLRKELLAIILVGLIVIVSGCTMPNFGGGEKEKTPGPGSKGVIIQSFGPDVNYISSGQPINLILKAQNIGSEKAKITKVTPILLSWSDFIDKEKTPNEELDPPNPEIDKKGDIYTATWSDVNAPKVSKVQDYKAGVILSYEYNTTAVSNTYALKASEINSRKESGETIPKTEPTRNSDAPIHLTFRMQEDPLVIPTSGTKTKTGTIMISRVGTGNVEWDDTAKKYKIDIEFPNPEPINGVTISKGTCDSVTLRGGTEGECTFKVELNGDTLTSPEVKIPLKAVADYTFEIGTKTTLTVHPAIE